MTQSTTEQPGLQPPQPLPTFVTPAKGNPEDPVVLLGFPRCMDLVASPSPYVSKVEAWLRFAGIGYTHENRMPWDMPKKKVPCLRHGKNLVPDSYFIVRYLEATYGAALYAPPSQLLELSPGQAAQAQALVRLIADHLMPIFAYFRWVLTEEEPLLSFAKNGLGSTEMVPGKRASVQEVAIKRGLGAHSRSDLLVMVGDDAAALAETLGDKPYLLGDKPCVADATLFGLLDQIFYDSCSPPDLKACFDAHPSLKALCDRVREGFFADMLPLGASATHAKALAGQGP